MTNPLMNTGLVTSQLETGWPWLASKTQLLAEGKRLRKEIEKGGGEI